MALSHSPSIVTSGLILNLDAANRRSYPGTGTVWTDLSGNRNNGILSDGPTFDSRNGGSISFAPVTNPSKKCNVNHNQIFNSPGVTMSCWFYVNSLPGGETPLIRKEIQWALQLDSASRIFNLITIAGVWGGKYMYYPFVINRWYNLLATYDAISEMKTYVDGIFLDNYIRTGSIDTNTNNIAIGHGCCPTSVNGNISIVQVYNRALSASEVAQNFNALRGRFGI